MSVLSKIKRGLVSVLGGSRNADEEASDPYLCARCGATYDRQEKECRQCGAPFIVENRATDSDE